MGSVSFNIHRVAEQIGRPVLLSVMTINAIKKLHLHEAFDKIDYSRMSSFLSKIFQGYRRDVEYHNDLHAADVMQMCFLMLTSGGIVERAELNSIDVLSIVWAAVCHDFKHDGFSNIYHVNSISDRAIRYSDLSV
jgi:hypothetical protein